MRFRAEAEKALVEVLIDGEWTELKVGVLPAEETLRHRMIRTGIERRGD